MSEMDEHVAREHMLECIRAATSVLTAYAAEDKMPGDPMSGDPERAIRDAIARVGPIGLAGSLAAAAMKYPEFGGRSS